VLHDSSLIWKYSEENVVFCVYTQLLSLFFYFLAKMCLQIFLGVSCLSQQWHFEFLRFLFLLFPSTFSRFRFIFLSSVPTYFTCIWVLLLRKETVQTSTFLQSTFSEPDRKQEPGVRNPRPPCVYGGKETNLIIIHYLPLLSFFFLIEIFFITDLHQNIFRCCAVLLRMSI
jgi:hypothetical protein